MDKKSIELAKNDNNIKDPHQLHLVQNNSSQSTENPSFESITNLEDYDSLPIISTLEKNDFNQVNKRK